jgi:glycosyltransferase involved in cell wall biosynthesis
MIWSLAKAFARVTTRALLAPVAADAESFAQALVRVLSVHALRRSLGEAGLALGAGRYSVEAAAEGFERVHAQVLAR